MRASGRFLIAAGSVVTETEQSAARSTGVSPAASASSTWPPASSRQPRASARSSSKRVSLTSPALPMKRGSTPSAPATSGARISTPRGAPGKRSAVRQRSATSETATCLPARPLGLALLEECLHTLLDVLRREGERELRAEEVERVLERHVELPVHRVLAELHQHGRLRGELLRPVVHRGIELGVGHDPVDDPGLTRRLGRHPL